MFQIYIPSKGRPDFATARLFNEPHPPCIDPYVVVDIDMEEKPRPYTVFLEPQDFEAYRKAGHASIVVLPENDKGIAYARQAILDYAIQNGDKWFWMIDDDVIQFSAYQLDGYEDALIPFRRT
jgi:TET-associated glycosyltransferase-like protein